MLFWSFLGQGTSDDEYDSEEYGGHAAAPPAAAAATTGFGAGAGAGSGATSGSSGYGGYSGSSYDGDSAWFSGNGVMSILGDLIVGGDEGSQGLWVFLFALVGFFVLSSYFVLTVISEVVGLSMVDTIGTVVPMTIIALCLYCVYAMRQEIDYSDTISWESQPYVNTRTYT